MKINNRDTIKKKARRNETTNNNGRKKDDGEAKCMQYVVPTSTVNQVQAPTYKALVRYRLGYSTAPDIVRSK